MASRKEVGNLYVKLSADASKWIKGMQSAQRQTNKTLRLIKKDLSSLKASFISAGAAIAGWIAVDTVKRTAEYADALGKISDRIGITTEDLLGLRHAAELSGISHENLSSALTEFSKSMGEARDGIGRGKIAFEKLGLSADALTRLPLADAFKIVSDNIKALGTQAEKTAVSNKLFGSTGKDLITVMDQGSVAINSMMKEAKDLGLVVSRLEITQIEQMNDSFSKAAAVIRGQMMKSLAAVAPTITDLTNEMIAFGKEVRLSAQDFIKGFKTVASSLEYVILTVRAFNVGIKTIEVSIKAVIAGVLKLNSFLVTGFTEFGRILIHQVSTPLNLIAKQLLRLASSPKVIGTAFQEQFSGIALSLIDASKEIKSFQSDADEIKQFNMDMATSSLDTFNKSFRELEQMTLKLKEGGTIDAKFFEKLKSSLDGAIRKQREYIKIKEQASSTSKTNTPTDVTKSGQAQQVTAEIDLIRDGFKSFYKDYEIGINDMKSMYTNWADGFTDTLNSAFQGQKVSFKSLVDSMINDMMRMIIKQSITAPLMKSFGGMLNIPGFAEGGQTPTNKPFIVGENGAEMMSFKRPAYVTPNSDLQGSMNKSGEQPINITQNITFGEGVNAAAEQAVMNMTPYIRNQAMLGVQEAMRRRGKSL